MIKILINKTGSTKVSIFTIQKNSLQGWSTNQSVATPSQSFMYSRDISHTDKHMYYFNLKHVTGLPG